MINSLITSWLTARKLIANDMKLCRLKQLKAKSAQSRSAMKSSQEELEKLMMEVPSTWSVMASQFVDMMKDAVALVTQHPYESVSNAISKSYDYVNSVESLDQLKQVIHLHHSIKKKNYFQVSAVMNRSLKKKNT